MDIDAQFLLGPAIIIKKASNSGVCREQNKE